MATCIRLKTERCERTRKGGGWFPPGGEFDRRGIVRGGRRPFAQQVSNTASDRGGGIETGDRPRRIGAEALEQQRIMRAGKNNRVGAARVCIYEATRNLTFDRRTVYRLAREFSLRIGGESWRSHQVNVAARRKFANQCPGIFSTDRRLGNEHRDALAF